MSLMKTCSAVRINAQN